MTSFSVLVGQRKALVMNFSTTSRVVDEEHRFEILISNASAATTEGRREKKKKRIINAYYCHYNLIIRRPRFPLSLVNHFLSLVQSHNHNNMFSLHTSAPCSLFFVQNFPSLSLSLSLSFRFLRYMAVF